MNTENIEFTDHSAAKKKPDAFIEVTVDSAKVIASWRSSIFSFEWLTSEGEIKPAKDLPEREQAKRSAVENRLSAGEAIEKPVLGIGIQDNVEIGAGKTEFLTLAALGRKSIPVHIPKSNENDFKAFMSDID